jgi:hypothetical protein
MWCIKIWGMSGKQTHSEVGTLTYHVEFSCQEWCATVLRLALVRWVILKKFLLRVQCLVDRLVGIDVTLATIHDGNISQAQVNDTPGKNIDNICALVPASLLARTTGKTCTRLT